MEKRILPGRKNLTGRGLLWLGTLLILQMLTPVQDQSETYQKIYDERQERTEWFRDARFGMFIHWGIYAIPARGEWVRSAEEMTIEEYQPYFEEFDPVNYDPMEWARLAKEAGI